jgi:hypothetical protein
MATLLSLGTLLLSRDEIHPSRTEGHISHLYWKNTALKICGADSSASQTKCLLNKAASPLGIGMA